MRTLNWATITTPPHLLSYKFEPLVVSDPLEGLSEDWVEWFPTHAMIRESIRGYSKRCNPHLYKGRRYHIDCLLLTHPHTHTLHTHTLTHSSHTHSSHTPTPHTHTLLTYTHHPLFTHTHSPTPHTHTYTHTLLAHPHSSHLTHTTHSSHTPHHPITWVLQLCSLVQQFRVFQFLTKPL